MAFVSDKQAAGLYNNQNPFTSPPGALSVADNVTIFKQDEIEGRFVFNRCSNGLPAAAPRQLFTFEGTIVVHINNQMWFEYDVNCNFRQFSSPGIPLYLPRTFTMYPNDANTIIMNEYDITIQRYKDIARVNLTTSYSETLIGTVADTELNPLGSDGTLSSARLSSPYGVCSDNNFIYIADCGSATIRKADKTTGATTTIAGVLNTASIVGVDGALGINRLVNPAAICVDTTANTVYFLDGGFPLLPVGAPNWKKLDLASGVVTTIAVNPLAPTTNGIIPYSLFTTPTSLYAYVTCTTAFQSGGSTFLSLYGYAVARITKTTGAATILSGNWSTAGDAVGTAANTRFQNPGQICGDLTNTNLYVATRNSNRIVKIDVATGNSSYLFGSGVKGIKDGNGVNCQLANPAACWVSGNTMWIGCSDTSTSGLGAIMRADLTTGDVTTYARFSTGSTRTQGFIIKEIQEPIP